LNCGLGGGDGVGRLFLRKMVLKMCWRIWRVVGEGRERDVYMVVSKGSGLDICIDGKRELRSLKYRPDVVCSIHSQSFPVQC